MDLPGSERDAAPSAPGEGLAGLSSAGRGESQGAQESLGALGQWVDAGQGLGGQDRAAVPARSGPQSLAKALQRQGGNRQVPYPGQTAQAVGPGIGGHGGGERGRKGEGIGIELARKIEAESADANAQLAQTAPL